MPFRFTDPAGYRYKSGDLFLGHDDRGNEIGVTTEVHAITIGGSGSGKGVGLLTQNAMRWPENSVSIDLKGRNAEICWKVMEERGHRVAVLDPFHASQVPDRLRASFNPLGLIDPASRFARVAVSAVTNGLVVVHDRRHMEWVEGARSILAGIVAYIVTDAPPEARTLTTMRDILMQPDGLPRTADDEPSGLYADALRMAADKRMGGLIRDAGITIMTALESQKGMEKDFLSGARRATRWLDDENIAATLSSSTVDFRDLKHGNLSLFVVLPADPDVMASYAPFLRLIVKSALNAMTGGGQDQTIRKRCLFLLDEFYSLGKLEEIAEAAGRMRDSGVHLWPFLQNLGQLHELYGVEGSQTFFTNADAHVFLGNDKDNHTLKYISARIGSVTAQEIVSDPPRSTYVRASYVKTQPAHIKYTSLRSYAELDDDFVHGFKIRKWQRHGESLDEYKARLATEDENMRRAAEAENLAAQRQQTAEDENARRHQAAEDENARRHQAAEDQNARLAYEHQMRRVGRPRLEPDEIAELIGKGNGEKLARSMIVFAQAGHVLNLRVAPYYEQAKKVRVSPWAEAGSYVSAAKEAAKKKMQEDYERLTVGIDFSNYKGG